jgi:ferredoxin-NADP reductase
MLQHLARHTTRDILWVHGARCGDELAFGPAVRELAASRRGISCLTLFERAGPQDVHGRDFDLIGRLSTDLLRTHLPSGEPDVYYSGPTGFMAAVEHILDELGVEEHRRHTETFGPSASFAMKAA